MNEDLDPPVPVPVPVPALPVPFFFFFVVLAILEEGSEAPSAFTSESNGVSNEVVVAVDERTLWTSPLVVLPGCAANALGLRVCLWEGGG